MRQGEIFWVDFGVPRGTSPGYLRPAVVVQNNLFNNSGIRSVVVCVLTANLRRGRAPGNVLLRPGEGDLPEQSVVNVSQLFTVDSGDLRHRIGMLDGERVRDILKGINLLLEPREAGTGSFY